MHTHSAFYTRHQPAPYAGPLRPRIVGTRQGPFLPVGPRSSISLQLARPDFKGGQAAGGRPPGVLLCPDADLEAGACGPEARPGGEARARERVRPAESRVADWAGGLQELSSETSTRRGGSRSGPRAQPGWSPRRLGRATRRLSQPRPQRPGFHRK